MRRDFERWKRKRRKDVRKILYVVGRQAETNFLGGGEQLLQDSESFHSDVFTAPANTLTLTHSALSLTISQQKLAWSRDHSHRSIYLHCLYILSITILLIRTIYSLPNIHLLQELSSLSGWWGKVEESSMIKPHQPNRVSEASWVSTAHSPTHRQRNGELILLSFWQNYKVWHIRSLT